MNDRERPEDPAEGPDDPDFYESENDQPADVPADRSPGSHNGDGDTAA